ncbi:MAG: peptidyl-prolyl cis-trans isomerase [Acidobacteriota bacterium]
MLAFFRKSMPFLKPILLLVVVTFVLFFGVSWWSKDSGQGAPTDDFAAKVRGSNLTMRQFMDEARRLDEQYRRMFGERYADLRKQIGVERQAIENLVQQELVLQDARRLGLTVSSDELNAAVYNMQVFQRDGRFAGKQVYEQILRSNGQRPEQFEAGLEQSLVISKWQQLLGASVLVAKSDVEAEYRRRHEKANFEYIALPLDRFEKEDAAPADSELKAYFDQNQARYKEGEGRRALYALFDDKAVEKRVQLTDAEVQAYYDTNKASFEIPEQRRARHVLIKVDADAPADKVEAAKAQAQDISVRAKGGEDFAKLAAQYSDDTSSKVRGGDLGFFPRGQMVPEFDEATFSLPPGQISAPIRTQFGFHVIKVEESRPAGAQPLDAVRKQIEGQLKFQRLKDVAGQMAQEFIGKLKAGVDFKTAAQQMNIELQDTGVVTRSSAVPGLGPVPALIESIFTLEKGKYGEAVTLPRGQAVAQLQDVIADYMPPFDMRRERVRADYLRERSRDRAKAELAKAVAGGNLEAAAKSLKLEVRKAPAFTRGQDLQDVGYDAKLEEALFEAGAGRLTAPLDGPRAVVVARMISRESADMSKLATEEATIRETLKAPRMQRLLQERVQALRKESESAIWINPVLQQAAAQG